MFHQQSCSIRRMAPGLLLTLALSLVTAPATAQYYDYDTVGGDDLLVTTGENLLYSPSMDIAENGDTYVAVATSAVVGGPGPEIRVYRSQDFGDSWPLWGTITLAVAPALIIDDPCVHIGEGTQNRIFVAYRYRGPTDTNNSIVVAWSNLSLGSALWNTRQAMAQNGVDFQSPSIHSDEMSNAGYRLYLAAMGSGLDGGDAWFARSIDFGNSWENEYEIFSSTTNDQMFYPEIRYGRDGVVHCVCYYNPTSSAANDMAVRYRRALNYAATAANWQPIVNMTPETDGLDQFHASVAALHSNDRVMVGWAVKDGGGIFQPSVYRVSADGGSTWTVTPSNATPENELPHLLAVDAASGIYAWGNRSGSDIFGASYYRITGNAWMELGSPLDRPYSPIPSTRTGNQYCDYDMANDNQVGYIWMTYNPAGADSIFFDSRTRTDPGFPNIAPGFPIALASGVVAPPAIVELDGDVQSEIVFGTADGNIHVYNHDGTIVTGWPIDIGTFHADATIAVGNIIGNSDNEVVAGNSTGVVHAFQADGTPLSGWPMTLVSGSPVYLAIGAISTVQRQVVTCCSTRVHLINGNGSIAPNFPMQPNTPVSCPPALGDVDNDGDRDIVILQQNIMNVLTGEGTVQAVRGFGGVGKTFSNAPTLADLDLDDDLEIVAPTDQGDIYAMYGDGTDFAGWWPYHDPAGVRLTSVAMAASSTGAPRIFFCREGPAAPVVQVLYADGSGAGSPHATTPGWYLHGMPIVDRLDWTNPEVIVATRDMNAYAWKLDGTDVQGWPKWLAARHNVSPASGDIDNDNNLELVFTSYSPAQLTVVDVQGGEYRHPNFSTSWWPMYAYNPMRQGCLACDDDYVSGVDEETPQVGRILFAVPSPNPSSGPVGLRFELPEPVAARLDIFDVNGRLVRRLVKAELPAGPHEVAWDGTDEGGAAVTAGSYYLRLTVDDGTGTPAINRKVVLIR